MTESHHSLDERIQESRQKLINDFIILLEKFGCTRAKINCLNLWQLERLLQIAEPLQQKGFSLSEKTYEEIESMYTKYITQKMEMGQISSSDDNLPHPLAT